MQQRTEKGITEEVLMDSVRDLVRIIGTPNVKYKDQMFRMLVKDKKVALEIYNGINDTDYDDPDALTMKTLENAVYMGMKNDVSFLIDGRLMLYEHQSTKNPNMPLRDLFYVACIFATLIRDENIYKSSLVSIPTPKFVVFYNGKDEMPDRWQMRLSDAFEKKDTEVSLQLIVDVININPGHNDGLVQKSPTLYQYIQFVDRVRKYEKSHSFEVAMELAIDECIAKGILSDFLQQNRAEVLRVCLFEYDQEKHIQQEREESREEGRRQGREEGRKQGREEGREERMALVKMLLTSGRTVEEISRTCNIPLEELHRAGF